MTPAEYFKLRLEHTLQHLQQSTRLIYLVNGAVLAMLYFVVKLEHYPYKRGTVVFILLVLAFINLVHALFIRRQSGWYHIFDDKLAGSLTKKIEKPKAPNFPPFGTSTLYATLHVGLAGALALAAVLLLQITGWP